MTFDYIIVGQGLAGSTLAYQLVRAGKKLAIFNKEGKQSSSMVAAGIYNPITGRKMVKTWKADLLFPYLSEFYKGAERVLSAKFLHEIDIFRPFVNIEEQNEWMGKSAVSEYDGFVKNVHRKNEFEKFVNAQFGGLELKSCGYLDIPVFLKSMKQHLRQYTAYHNSEFEESRMQVSENGVKYESIDAKKIIFCDGMEGQNSTFFDWLPFRLVKGEILIVESESPLPKIFNRGVFVLPIKGNVNKVGSTYDNHDLSLKTTKKAKAELSEKLDALLSIDYKVINQVVGIRPATKDRRPFIGFHPDFGNVGVFNGFGAKGVSLAPYFSKVFVSSLEKGGLLDTEVNISRFFSLN